MIISGREYKFMLTVKARRDVRALCPGGDIGKLSDYLSGADVEEKMTEVILALSKGYEEYMEFWEKQAGKEYEPQPLTAELISMLDMEDYRTLETEAFDAFARGMGVTVETEEVKTKGKGKKSEQEKQS